MTLRSTVDTLIGKFEKDFVTHNRIEISTSAILHNLALFQQLSGKRIIPVLKGNAYGHGVEQVATILSSQDIPYVAVDGYFEALRVRKVSKQPVLIMGAIKPENFSRLRYNDFAFVVQDETTIRALAASGRRINVHLECNTGMSRYGVQPSEATTLARLIMSFKNLTLEGIMSHLADSDGNDPDTVDDAVQLFDNIVKEVLDLGATPRFIHIAQTAGSLKAKSQYADTLRLGIGLYGINPFSPKHSLHAALKNLRPALQLISTITKTIDLQEGESVSYNYTYTAPKQMQIGVLPLGYYEGLNRALSNVGSIRYKTTNLPIIGRICMNHTMIDLGETKAQEGTEIIVYSNDPTARNSISRIADEHDLFNYNLLTALSPDVRRVVE
jgi:alanine racemase